MPEAAWRKSSRSNGDAGDQANCAEVAELSNRIAMRDSKDSAGHVLAFTCTEWRAFLGGIRASEFG